MESVLTSRVFVVTRQRRGPFFSSFSNQTHRQRIALLEGTSTSTVSLYTEIAFSLLWPSLFLFRPSARPPSPVSPYLSIFLPFRLGGLNLSRSRSGFMPSVPYSSPPSPHAARFFSPRSWLSFFGAGHPCPFTGSSFRCDRWGLPASLTRPGQDLFGCPPFPREAPRRSR